MLRTIFQLGFLASYMVAFSPMHLRAGWAENGIAVCPSLGDQWYAYIAPDGEGGAIITWDEYRVGPDNSDIFCQRVDKGGNILWAPAGVPICTTEGTQIDPRIESDGEGGALICWRDARNGTFDIYAQRINAEGVTQWAINGVNVCIAPYGQYGPSIVRDGSGGFIIAWLDDRNGVRQIYCQKLDESGKGQWAANGIAVCPTVWWQDISRAVSDGSGGAIITWEDKRYSVQNSFIYGQRIDTSGNVLWQPAGVPITQSAGLKWQLCAIEDDCGGAYVTWSSGSDGYINVFAQRIDSNGAIWAQGDIPICALQEDQDNPAITLDGAAGAIIVWHDRREGRDDIYAQRVSGDGIPLWTPNGIPVRLNRDAGLTPWTIPAIASDGVGGALITWGWGWGTPTSYDVFAQRIDFSGNLLWPDAGIVVCSAPDGQYFPQMIANSEGGAIIAWRDLRQDTIGAVYAMRVTANGETVATLLQGFSARARSSSIVLEWRLADIDSDAKFHVLRSSGNAAYEEIDPADISREGLSFEFTDETCIRGVEYRYRVDVETGGERTVLFESEPILLPRLELSLAQNYPNPFNPSTTIRFTLDAKTNVRLGIYDCAGREIVRLIDEERISGDYSTLWDGTDARGKAVSTGIYFYRLTAGKRTITKKMILLK